MSTSPGDKSGIQPKSSADMRSKPIIIGLYGVPGTGKTYLSKWLQQNLDGKQFAFYEGSEIVPGGLDAFKNSSTKEKTEWRQKAITWIGNRCTDIDKVGIVTGHFMFWQADEDAGDKVWTQADAETFTHILYLGVHASVVAQQRQQDVDRNRTPDSVEHLRKWQDAEKSELRTLCREHGILFSVVDPTAQDTVVQLLKDFREHNTTVNFSRAASMLDGDVAAARERRLETMLVFDADKTLAAEDAGEMFWGQVSGKEKTLKMLFDSRLKYTYSALRQATLLYEKAADEQSFDAACEHFASAVHMHAEFKGLLEKATTLQHVGAAVVTCDLRRVWEKVLAREGLSAIQVIGGGRIKDGSIVTAAVKGALVTRLQDKHGLYVWAFGDSPLDLEMLGQADRAIVVVGEEQTRSKTMDAALTDAIDNHGLQTRQMLLPTTASPRLDTAKLPEVRLDNTFANALLGHRLQLLHATDTPAAKLLMTPTRNAEFAGVSLREAHRRVGWYLATQFLTLPSVIGLAEYKMVGVQKKLMDGHRLLNEQTTVIVPLMRGGEPMAFGVNEAFPLASFVHAKHPPELEARHLKGMSMIVLVDSVVNKGISVADFVQHIRSNLDKSIRIVVVASVVQKDAIAADSKLAKAVAANGGNLCLVALRLSDNQYTGKGTTDTGNRLFNTTQLE
ncbi:hypothetical protein LTR85_012177 [Meristemomyces frigidus]|nr:hypothetical protein LTR85_012177 [Meristemomyces frigidus]